MLSQGKMAVDITVTEPKVGSDESVSPVPEDRAKKTRRKSRSSPTGDDHKHALLSTSSPEGLAAAAQVTPNRIATLLLKQGPLPIRHITGHLASQIAGFSHLSLSKQRRLIIAALEMGDPETGCVFEKIGWGQWEARKVSEDEIRLRNSAKLSTSPGSSFEAPKTIKKRVNSLTDEGSAFLSRRESITNPATDPHNARVPTSPSLNPIQSLRNSFRSRQISLDAAIDSSSDEEELEYDDDGSEVFAFENDDSSDSAKPSARSHRRPSFGRVMKPRKPRASFNSQSIEAALDGNSIEGGLDAAAVPESVVSRRRPRASFNTNLSRQSFLRTNISPETGPLTIHGSMSNIDITKASSTDLLSGPHSETDEEDWESIGAASLRRSSALTPPTPLFAHTQNKLPDNDEEMAAQVLMELKSV